MFTKILAATSLVALLTSSAYGQDRQKTTTESIGHVTLIKGAADNGKNTGGSNPILKQAEAGDGGVVVKSCGFVAAPQGFTVAIVMKDYDTSSNLGLKTSVIVDDVTPWIFATSAQGAPIGTTGSPTDPGPTTALAENLGLQSSSNGVHPQGGWAHTTTGQIITGTVFHIRGHSAGTAYSGGYKSHQFDGGMTTHFGTNSCSTSTFNTAITKLNQAVGGSVPGINGASTAYNDTGYSTGTGPSGGGSDWAGDLYNSYYASGNGPGWHFSTSGVTQPSGGASVSNVVDAAPIDNFAKPKKPLPVMPKAPEGKKVTTPSRKTSK